jgi:hypothetical protein
MSLVTHRFLRGHRNEIISAWERAVATTRAREIELTDPALRDQLPELLDELADWLRSSDEPGAAGVRASRSCGTGTVQVRSGLPAFASRRGALVAHADELERSGRG